MIRKIKEVAFLVAGLLLFLNLPYLGAQSALRAPTLTAKSAVIVDANNGGILYSKKPNLKLPPASTTKLMTVLLAVERLKMNQRIFVSARAANAPQSCAGLSVNTWYPARDLILASVVSSSNDAAVALAEAVSGSEGAFAKLMNRRAKELGMMNTHFVNATGLTERGKTQYSTAMDLAKLMRRVSKNKEIDRMMGVTTTFITGSDRKTIFIKSHNKMLWKMPKFVKGKTGWTYASRHTFVGTDYSSKKRIMFAMLYSQKPWMDIEKLATFGFLTISKIKPF